MAEMQIAVRATARSGKRVAWLFYLIVLLATPIAHDPLPPHRRRSARPALAAADPRRSAADAGRRQGRRLRPAPARGGISRPVRHRVRPAAVDRERRAIWGRLFAAFDPFHHDTVRAARTDKLARLGLSARQDQVDPGNRQGRRQRPASISTAVGNMDADAAHAALTALHGIGPVDRRHLSAVLPRPCRCLAGRRSRGAGSRAHRASGCASAPDAKAADQARRGLAALARRGGASAVGLLSRGQAARGRLAAAGGKKPTTKKKAATRKSRNG